MSPIGSDADGRTFSETASTTFVLLPTACNNDFLTVRNPMSQANETALLSFIDDVWNNGRLDTIDSYLAQQYTIHHDPGDPWEHQTLSIDGFRERVRESRSTAPDQSFDIQSIMSDDEKVSITWLWSGTHTGEISGFPPSRKKLTMSGATIYYFADGLLTGHWQIADRLSIYQQLMANSQAAT